LRITKAELLRLTGVGTEEDKSLHRRGQLAIAFGCDAAPASDWYMPVDCVAALATKSLAQSYRRSTAASLVRAFGHVLLGAVSKAEAARDTDAALMIIDFIREADGKRAYTACTVLDPQPETPQGFVVERVVTVNISFLIRCVCINAARCGIDLSAPFLPTPNSTSLAAIVKPYIDLALPDVVEERALPRHERTARRAGEIARSIAMGGVVETGTRKPSRKAP
jgi:hypothetical protein